MKPSEAIKIYSKTFKLLENCETPEHEHFYGYTNLTPSLIDDLKALVKFELCETSTDLYNEGTFVASVAIDSLEEKHFKFKCRLGLTCQWERAGYYICEDWDTLLKSPAKILTPIKQAFFTKTSELTSSKSQAFNNYLKLSKVCNLIDKVALSTNDNTTRTVVYKRDINIHYTLKSSDLEYDFCVKPIERLLHEDMHHEAKVTLVREALVKFLGNKGVNQRFGYLISHFNAFTGELMLSYQGYVEQYTFDKVRKEYQEKQTEYIRKTNESYSDVGAKVLAIPAGLWLAIFKLEEASVGTFGFIKNIMILILCLLCMTYVFFHFFAQFAILDSIKTEYQSLFSRLEKEYEYESKNIIAAKTLIDKNATWAWWKLALSNFATAIVGIMVITLGCYSITPP
jgi:hypothetical protein